MAETQHIRLTRLPELESKFGRKRSALYEQIKNGLIPEPVKVGPRAAAWPEHEIDLIVAAVVAGVTDAQRRDLVKFLLAQRAAVVAIADTVSRARRMIAASVRENDRERAA